MNRAWRKPLIFLLLFALVGWGTYRFLFKSKVEQIKTLRQEKELIEREITQRTAQGESLLQGEVDAVHKKLQAEIVDLSKALPFEAEAPRLFKQFLSTVKEKTGIEYRLFQPGAFVDDGKYRRLPVKIVLVGMFQALEKYFQELEKLPMITHADRIVMKHLEKALPGAPAQEVAWLRPLLAMDLELAVFVFPGGEKKQDQMPLPFLSAIRDPFFSHFFSPENLPWVEQLAKLSPLSDVASGEAGVPPPSASPLPEVAKTKTTKKELDLHYGGYWQGRNPKAFVNGALVAVGERVEGYVVQSLDEEQVLLRKGAEVLTLYLEE